MSLDERKEFLDAPSTAHLCKTIIMQNSRHSLGVDSFPEVGDDPSYPKNVIIITQFEGKHNSNRIVNIMKKYQNEKT